MKISDKFRQLIRLITAGKVFTIPNLLSVFRLILAAAFLAVYQMDELPGQGGWLAAILVVSGITDMLDGKIARHFHMISELGKILDPIADKVTQGILLLCLLSRYRLIQAVFALFVVKETYMAVMGAHMLMKTQKNEGAKWYGKLSTAVFYLVMVLLLLWPGIPTGVANTLIAVSGGCMLLSFVMYALQYHREQKECDTNKKQEAAAADRK